MSMNPLCRTGSCPRPSGLLGSKPPNPASIPSSSLTRAIAQLPITTTKPRAEQDRRNSNNITFQQKDFSATPKESRASKIRTTKELSRSAWVTSCRQPDIAFQQISGQWKGVKVFRDWEERCNWGKWGWWLCVHGEHGQPAQHLSWGSLQGRLSAPQSWQGGSFKMNQVFQWLALFSVPRSHQKLGDCQEECWGGGALWGICDLQVWTTSANPYKVIYLAILRFFLLWVNIKTENTQTDFQQANNFVCAVYVPRLGMGRTC